MKIFMNDKSKWKKEGIGNERSEREIKELRWEINTNLIVVSNGTCEFVYDSKHVALYIVCLRSI